MVVHQVRVFRQVFSYVLRHFLGQGAEPQIILGATLLVVLEFVEGLDPLDDVVGVVLFVVGRRFVVGDGVGLDAVQGIVDVQLRDGGCIDADAGAATDGGVLALVLAAPVAAAEQRQQSGCP